jgi:hypothetical protein
MMGDRPEPRAGELATSDDLKGWALFGYVSAVVLVFIGQLLMSSRYGFMIRFLLAIMGVLLLITVWAYWGSLMYGIVGWLGLPVGLSEAPTPLEIGALFLVLLLSVGPLLVVGFLANRWLRRRLLPWLKDQISLFEP